MPSQAHSVERAKPSLAFIMLVSWLVILWISGGSSRADVPGQVITRAAAFAILAIYVLAAPRPRLRPIMPVALFLFAAIALAAIQLVPLPPPVWSILPGREIFEQAALVSKLPQPWRPLSISPGATVNALASLIVPFLTLLLLSAVTWSEQRRILSVLLSLIFASSLVGLLQFSGAHFDHPLINDIHGMVSGSFANRNHLALFVAIGCVLAPAWAFGSEHQTRWKGLLAMALLPFFALIILATGSRTGMLVGVLGIAIGLFNVRKHISRQLRALPKPMALGLAASSIALLATPIILSISFGRAISLERVFALDASEDLRRKALPTVWEMVTLYFPAGSGVGTFDPVYRIHEKDELLNILYFNHAHNDLVEVVLDAGLVGALLLGLAIVWWLWKSVNAWRTEISYDLLPRLGSAIILLTLIASATDYPVRTPVMMAIIMIAAVWLNGDKRRDSPSSDRRRVRSER